MILGVAVGLGVLALVSARRAPASSPAPPGSPDEPPALAGREEWVQLKDAPGLAVRAPSRSWTSPAVREQLLAAGQVAASLGGHLQVGDVGPALRGSVYPPHKSHRWGRDLDLAYTLEAYPTPDEVPVDPRLLAVLSTLAPVIEVAGVNASRLAPFAGAPFKVSAWPGHAHHIHLRLRRALVSELADV